MMGVIIKTPLQWLVRALSCEKYDKKMLLLTICLTWRGGYNEPLKSFSVTLALTAYPLAISVKECRLLVRWINGAHLLHSCRVSGSKRPNARGRDGSAYRLPPVVSIGGERYVC